MSIVSKCVCVCVCIKREREREGIPFVKHIFGRHGNDVHGVVYSESTFGNTSSLLPTNTFHTKIHGLTSKAKILH